MAKCPRAIRQKKSGGRVMYYLIHATDHDVAPSLMRRAYDNAARPAPSPQMAMQEIEDLLPPAPSR